MKLRRLGIILLIALATVVALQYSDTEPASERAYREWFDDRATEAAHLWSGVVLAHRPVDRRF